MKRFLSLLTVFVLAFSLAVPASATDYNGVELPPFPTELNGSSWEDALSVFPYVYIIPVRWQSGVYYVIGSPVEWVVSEAGAFLPVVNTQVVQMSCHTGDESWGGFQAVEYNSDGLGEFQPIWSNNDVYSATGDLFLSGSDIFCDGSSCPAADANADGICDDCGKILSLRVTGYPALPTVSGNNKHGVVLQRDDGYFYMSLTSDTPYSVSGTVGESYIITVANETKVSYATYKCTDGQNWVHTNSGEAYSLSVGSSSDTLLASTFDWSKDGEHFFPVPPTLAEATETALGGMTSTLGGTMKVLAVCGVGLMACLMVLNLFGKRSLIFLR